VKVTEEQEARLVELAGARGITVARLLVESALAGGAGAAAVQAELVAEVLRLGRALGKVGVNVNQIARATNATGEHQDHTVAVMAELQRVCARVDAVCGALDGTGTGTARRTGREAGQRVVEA
jgi:hypothetical protein